MSKQGGDYSAVGVVFVGRALPGASSEADFKIEHTLLNFGLYQYSSFCGHIIQLNKPTIHYLKMLSNLFII